MLQYKKPEYRQEFLRLDQRLIFVIYAYAGYMWDEFGKVTVITDVYREGGVHGDWRGVDTRTRHLTEDEGDAGIAFVNSIMAYDPDRPKYKVAHDERALEDRSPEATGEHVHFQSDPNGKMTFKRLL